MSWTSWAVEAMLGSALLMTIVLLVRGPVRRAFGPDIAYALWALPMLRLLLPPLPASWMPGGWTNAVATPVSQASEQVGALLAIPADTIDVAAATAPALATAPAAAPAMFDAALIAPALLLVWVGGAVLFAVWHALAHRRFCRGLLAAMTSDRQIDGIRVIETAAASGPLAFGIWRRFVALPSDLAERFDAEERDLALAHELGHHARGDLLANWIALLVLALHWFNPLGWRAFRAFRADQEMANDARVLAGLSPMRRHAYACALVKAASPVRLGGAASTACHLHTIDDLKGRLRMLTTTRVSKARLTAGAGTLALLIVAGLGVTASGTAAARMRTTVEAATGVDLGSAAQAAPAATPEPAAPPATAAPAASPAADGKAKRRYKIVVTEDGKTISEHDLPAPPPPGAPGTRVHRVVIRDKDGVVTANDFGPDMPLPPGVAMRIHPMPPMPPMPMITSMNCSEGTDKRGVITDEKDGRKRILICTNRIEKMAAEGAAMAANGKDIERNAYLHALMGLRGAKARMMATTDMTADQRKAALDGIDTAIKELEADLAKVQ